MEVPESIKAAIVSFYDDRLTQSQADDLLAWIGQNEENLSHFRQIGELNHVSYFSSETDFDSQSALKAIRKKITERGIRPLPQKEVRLRLSSVYKIAAALLVLVALAVAGSFYLVRTQKSAAPALFVETSAPKGSRSFIILPDSTTVWLNAGTKFRYGVDYGTANRTVYLDGEAYFKVSKNKHLPFKVYTSDITVTALGTAFNVKAYHDEGTIETTLEEGVVRIDDLAENKKDKPVILKPKQSAVFHKQGGQLAVQGPAKQNITKPMQQAVQLASIPVKVSNVADTRLYTSWKDTRWLFKNEKLSSLVTKLERRYDVEIHFMDKNLEDYAFTGILLEESLEQVLSAIQYTAPIRYEIAGKQVKLYEDKKVMNQYKGIMTP
ncbi:MAG TPA: FecR domain-containing protein [Bacteroidales bacterium]|nr:FecR domain-containing protein [Bacteroidales bacterium]